ncbi:hypothetical protein BGZ79_004430, partial [Entomortierella chlamydospora]
RSGSRIDTLPQDYARYSQGSLQEQGRGSFQYPTQAPSHRHPSFSPQFQRSSPSPGHASFPGPGAGL